MKKSEKKLKFWSLKYLFWSALLVAVFAIVYSASNVYFSTGNLKIVNPLDKQYSGNQPAGKDSLQYRNGSRLWIELAMELVKKNKPTPPESARAYAYASSVYADVLGVNKDPYEASVAEKEILKRLYAGDSARIDEYFIQVTNGKSPKLSTQGQKILQSYLDREQNDGHALVWDGVIPTGVGKWVGSDPYVPRAGEWKRWIIGDNENFNVPAPPVYGSAADLKEVQMVKDAVLSRDDKKWIPLIQFWAGGPGTEQPSGIWLNRVYDETKDRSVDDLTFARWQKILTQSVADSFMECWRVKFTYWTARPSMRMTKLNITQNDPNFPSYLSGHSTISRTAAVVLSSLVPDKKELWFANAQTARDTRLEAGIHFNVDNEQGAILGGKVGETVLDKIDTAKY